LSNKNDDDDDMHILISLLARNVTGSDRRA